MKNIDKNKKIASEWFKHLQNQICEELELIENKNKKKTVSPESVPQDDDYNNIIAKNVGSAAKLVTPLSSVVLLGDTQSRKLNPFICAIA